jgi:hypothetical protein
MFKNIMYVVGGFDGTRLNDIHHIAIPSNLYEEDSFSMRRISRPASSASGIMQTVPSDLVCIYLYLLIKYLANLKSSIKVNRLEQRK